MNNIIWILLLILIFLHISVKEGFASYPIKTPYDPPINSTHSIVQSVYNNLGKMISTVEDQIDCLQHDPIYNNRKLKERKYLRDELKVDRNNIYYELISV